MKGQVLPVLLLAGLVGFLGGCGDGGTGDYVIDGVNGYRLPLSAAAADFAACIKRNLNAASLQALHEGGLRMYKEKLSWKAWSRRFREIMEENGMG